ncbi:MAG: hypothetical protein PHR51_01180 [Patescibacteria group bacterium]|nr:hypothetical protein [Patescibacteria group bacterium]
MATTIKDYGLTPLIFQPVLVLINRDVVKYHISDTKRMWEAVQYRLKRAGLKPLVIRRLNELVPELQLPTSSSDDDQEDGRRSHVSQLARSSISAS